MKASFIYSLETLGIKIYPKGDIYTVYQNGKCHGDYTERELHSFVKSRSKAPTKPRFVCKTPRPGCACCDDPKYVVKKLDGRAKRRFNKRVERNIDFDMIEEE